MKNIIVKDYYEILGVSCNATLEEIEEAFQRKKKILNVGALHDSIRNRVKKSLGWKIYSEEEIARIKKEFAEVKVAYDILSSEERSLYDLELKEYKNNLRKQQEAAEQRARDEKILRQVEEEEKIRNIQELERKFEEAVKEEEREEQEEKIKEEIEREREEAAKQELRDLEERADNFANSILQAYREVREDEKRYSFRERHNRLYHKFDDSKIDSLPKAVVVRVGRCTLHVFLETFYQLSKLTYIGTDSIPKYVIRNRKLIAAATAGALIFGAATNDKVPYVESPEPVHIIVTEENKDDQDIQDNNNISILLDDSTVEEPLVVTTSLPVQQKEEQTLIDIDIDEDVIELERLYSVKFGDTLSELAEAAHITTKELKDYNDHESDMIYYDDLLRIPYTITKDNLKYYVAEHLVKDPDLEAIAKQYETTVETLCKLNKEAIVTIDGKKVILSRTLYVPNFITIRKYKEMKNNEFVKTYQ